MCITNCLTGVLNLFSTPFGLRVPPIYLSVPSTPSSTLPYLHPSSFPIFPLHSPPSLRHSLPSYSITIFPLLPSSAFLSPPSVRCLCISPLPSPSPLLFPPHRTFLNAVGRRFKDKCRASACRYSLFIMLCDDLLGILSLMR